MSEQNYDPIRVEYLIMLAKEVGQIRGESTYTFNKDEIKGESLYSAIRDRQKFRIKFFLSQWMPCIKNLPEDVQRMFVIGGASSLENELKEDLERIEKNE